MNPERRFLHIIGFLGLVLLAFSLRFSAPEFRPWEVVAEKGGYLFQPGRRVEMVEIGDLGYRSWVRALQHRRPVVFSTDSHGLRNPREMQRPDMVVIGDSYVVGSGVSDHETLSERLSARLGQQVYNYGLALGGTPELFLLDPRFQKAPPRRVVFAPVQRLLRPYLLNSGGRWPLWENAPLPLDEQLAETVSRFFTRLNRDNGLAVAARYGWNGLHDRIFGLPNALVVQGRRVLVLPIEQQALDTPAAERDPDKVVESIVELEGLLAGRGIELIFCPLFESGTIYPDLYPTADQRRIRSPSMLDLVIPEARRRGIETVDLRPSFRENRFPYLYLPDDSHLNARGLDLAARTIVRALQHPDR